MNKETQITTELARARKRQRGIYILINIVVIGVVCRLGYWQIFQQSHLSALADSEHTYTYDITAQRGTIYDANGDILALNMSGDALYLHTAEIRTYDESHSGMIASIVSNLSSILQIPSVSIQNLISDPSQSGAYLEDANFIHIHLNSPQQAKVENLINSGQIVDIDLIPETWREYPDNTLASQLLGYTSIGSGKGTYGVEQYYNQILAGKDGTLEAQADESGNPLPDGTQSYQAPVNGSSLKLTIDENIQRMVEEDLQQAATQHKAASGTIVIMDPKTGAIIAMASTPNYDPNNYNQVPADQYGVFVNPAISSLYDPGSTMKPITMSMAVDKGEITPDTVFQDPGYYVADGIPIHNWDFKAHPNETMVQVLTHSANAGASWVALTKLGATDFYSYLHAYNFGSLTGIDLAGEDPGLLSQQHNDLTLAENSFGESIGVTPLQMVTAYTALANEGVMMKPYVVASTTNSQTGAVEQHSPQALRRVVSQQTADTVTQMLLQAVSVPQSMIPGYSIAAKSGTSTPDPANPLHTHASVIGYAPASNPRFVMLVDIDYPQDSPYGGLDSGPVWRDLALKLFDYWQIPPDDPENLK